MTSKSKEKTKEEIVPYQCYACKKYDGTFGPEKDSYTHCCEECKELPTEEQGPIDRHMEEYNAGVDHFGEDFLACPECGQERDECFCPDNPLRKKELVEEPKTVFKEAVYQIVNANEVRIEGSPLGRFGIGDVRTEEQRAAERRRLMAYMVPDPENGR